MTALSDANCTANSGDRTGSAVVTVNPRPTSVVSGSGTICNGGSKAIQAVLTGTGPWNLTWSDGNVQNGVAASPATRSVSPTSTTTYTVTALSDANCTAIAGDRTGSAVVTVNPLPVAVISGTATICAGASTNLTVTMSVGTGPYTVVIANHGTVNGYVSGTAIPVSPGSTTTYTLTSVVDANGCSATSMTGSAVVTVNPRPTSVASGSASICVGGSTTIQAVLTGTGPWNVTWSDGVTQNGVVASPATRSVSPAGTTTYTVTALSDANCASIPGDRTGSAVVSVDPRPTSVVSGSGTICSGGSKTIQAALTGTGPWHVTWSDGTQQDGVAVSPATRSVSPASTTVYTVTALHDTRCTANPGDLTGSATVTVDAKPSAPTGLSFEDVSACAQRGIKVNFTPGAPATVHYLVRGSTVVDSDYSSGEVYNPGDGTSYSYYVRAVNGSCTTNSGTVAGADANNTPSTPAAPILADINPCARSGITVSWSVVGGTTYDLAVDCATYPTCTASFTGITSPYTHSPGDGASHSYRLRANSGGCPSAWSDAASIIDADGSPAAPVLNNITDDAPCAYTGIHVNYTPSPDATQHDLVRGATVVVTNYVSGALYVPGNANLYTYTIRAYKGACSKDSNGVSMADGNGTPTTAPAITGFADNDPYAQDGILITYSAGAPAAQHDLYMDSVLAQANYISGALFNPADSESHDYFIRAVNGPCAADSNIQNITDASGASTITSITDADACAQSGIHVFYADVGAERYDLYRDGTEISNRVVMTYGSGALYNPGDTALHTYYICAVRMGGGKLSFSASQDYADGNAKPSTPAAPVAADHDACVSGRVDISWDPVAGATLYDLYVVESNTWLSSVTSPYAYDPLTSATRTYKVRGRNATCSGDLSPGTAAVDANLTPGTPTAPTVTDPDLCALTGVQISWGAVANADVYDLQVNGSTVQTGITGTSTTYSPGDSVARNYAVRGRNASCTGNWSPTTNRADANDPVGTPAGAPTGTDSNYCATLGLVLTWTGVSGATTYDLSVDCATFPTCGVTVAGVASGMTYQPGNTSNHTFRIRGRNANCTGGWGPALTTYDRNFTPPTPGAGPTVTDTNTCAQSGVNVGRVNLNYADGYDLEVDSGGPISMGTTNPFPYNPGNTLSHAYRYRGRIAYYGCIGGWSPVTNKADANNTPTPTISGPTANTCPATTVGLSTQAGMTGYQWSIGGAPIGGATTSAYTAGASGSYTVSYASAGCTGTSAPHVVTISVCEGPSPVADGKLAGTGATFYKDGSFAANGIIHVTYDTTTCSSHHAIVLFGELSDFSQYADDLPVNGEASCNLTTDGDQFDSSAQADVWYDILWVNASGAVGHPGHLFYDGADASRSLTPGGRCSTTTPPSYDPTCGP